MDEARSEAGGVELSGLSEPDRNYACYAQPTRMMRFWRRAGFVTHEVEEAKPPLEYTAGWTQNRTYIGLNWKDRLRVLISGRIYVETTIDSAYAMGEARSLIHWKIKAPGEPW